MSFREKAETAIGDVYHKALDEQRDIIANALVAERHEAFQDGIVHVRANCRRCGGKGEVVIARNAGSAPVTSDGFVQLDCPQCSPAIMVLKALQGGEG